MPVNWSDPQEIQAFRSAALQQPGADPAQLDAYIATKSATPKSDTTPSQTQAPQIQDVNPIVLPSLPKTEGVLPPADPLLPVAQNNTLLQDAAAKKMAQQSAIQPASQPPQAPDQQQPIQTQEKPSVYQAPQQVSPAPQMTPQVPMQSAGQSASSSLPSAAGILGQQGRVTQVYGQPSQYDVFSGKTSPAYEIGVPEGTTLATPPGQWKVVSAFNQAPTKGHIGDFSGQGWGNNVRLQNTQTGDTIGYNHMSKVDVQPGQMIDGNKVVGLSGMSGNATGPHVAFTLHDKYGRPRDFGASPYAQYMYGGQ